MNLIHKELCVSYHNVNFKVNKINKINSFKIDKAININYPFIYSRENINYIYFRNTLKDELIEGQQTERYIIKNDFNIIKDNTFILSLGIGSHNFRLFNFDNINYGVGGQAKGINYIINDYRKTNKDEYIKYNNNIDTIDVNKYNLHNNLVGSKILNPKSFCPYFGNGLSLFKFDENIIDYKILNNKLPIINGLKNGRMDCHYASGSIYPNPGFSVFDSVTSILQHNNTYYLYQRANIRTGIRNIQYCTSNDLINWSDFKLLKFKDLNDNNSEIFNIYYSNFFKINDVNHFIGIIPINKKYGSKYDMLEKDGTLNLYYSNNCIDWNYIGIIKNFEYYSEWLVLGNPIIKNNKYYFYILNKKNNEFELYEIEQNRLSYVEPNNKNELSTILFNPIILNNKKIIINFKTMKDGYLKFRLLDFNKNVIDGYRYTQFNIISENLNINNYELKWGNNSIIDYNDNIYIGLEGKNFELYSLNF
jgi:hypothetical protein